MSILDFLIFCLVIGVLVAIGVYKSRSIHSESAYLFAERETKWLALSCTLVMTEFNSATLISFSSLGYLWGFWALTLPFIFLVGLLFYAVTVAKKWKEFDGMSVAGFFTVKYGKNLGTTASLLLLMAMIGFSAVYIKSLILLFQPIFPTLNSWILSCLLLSIIFIMSIRGGLKAIIRTDTLSTFLLLIFFPLLAFFMWKVPPSFEVDPGNIFSIAAGQKILPIRFIISLTVLTMFTYILAPWYGQKIFSAKSSKVAFWSVFTAAIVIFFLYGLAIFATALFRYKGFGCPQSEFALPHLIQRCLPFGFKGLAYALLFISSATTLTGVWSAMSAMLIGDFLKSEKNQKEISCNRSIYATIFFAILSFILANTLIDSVLDKMILANIPVAALSFGLLAGFYWKKVSYQGVYLSIVTGSICGIGSYYIFGQAGNYTWYWTIYGIPLTFLVGTLTSLLLPPKPLLQTN